LSSPKPILTTSAARRKALRTKRHRHASSLIKRLNDCRRLDHAISVGGCKQQTRTLAAIVTPSTRSNFRLQHEAPPRRSPNGPAPVLAFGCSIEFVEVGHMA
jgi:hypothetical protein